MSCKLAKRLCVLGAVRSLLTTVRMSVRSSIGERSWTEESPIIQYTLILPGGFLAVFHAALSPIVLACLQLLRCLTLIYLFELYMLCTNQPPASYRRPWTLRCLQDSRFCSASWCTALSQRRIFLSALSAPTKTHTLRRSWSLLRWLVCSRAAASSCS